MYRIFWVLSGEKKKHYSKKSWTKKRADELCRIANEEFKRAMHFVEEVR